MEIFGQAQKAGRRRPVAGIVLDRIAPPRRHKPRLAASLRFGVATLAFSFGRPTMRRSLAFQGRYGNEIGERKFGVRYQEKGRL